MRKNILIIGVGQLGSRHLQGILKLNETFNIYIIDPSADSLEIAIQRAKEISHTHNLFFDKTWINIPPTLDLVIIATSSSVRAQIIYQLLSSYSVRFLVLEKVLFQKLEDYNKISTLIDQYQVKTWVNHPRRMLHSYKYLKSILKNSGSKVFQISGGDWGLGCNALHFIDLFAFLSDSYVIEVDAKCLDKEIIASKRKGFIEFTGTIKGLYSDESLFSITSIKNSTAPITLTIFDSKNQIIIQETGNPQIIFLNRDSPLHSVPFIMEYQSTLTTKLTIDLLEHGNCDLSTFEEALHSHKYFTIEMLHRYNQLAGTQTDILPIT